MKKLKFYTDGGCMTPNGPSGWGVYICDKDEGATFEIEKFGSILKSTNNRAEVTAAMKALEYAIEHSLESIQILTDSNYTLKGSTSWHKKWQANGWMKSDGTEVPNKDLWIQMVQLLKDFKGRVKWTKVPAHSGVYGNEKADALATQGNSLAAAGKEAEFTEVISDPNDKDAKAKSKPKAPKYNRMLGHRRWYFPSQEKAKLTECGRTVYYTGSHGGDDAFIGRRAADTLHSVAFLSKPEPVLEEVLERHLATTEDRLATLAVGRLDHILSSAIYADLHDPKDYTYVTKPNVPGICHINGTVLTYDHNPPIQGFIQLDDMRVLEGILADYLKGKPGLVATDITSALYDSSVKGKGKQERTVYKLKPELGTAAKTFTAKAMTPSSGMHDILFSLGHVAPTRNVLSALASSNPKVSVLTWAEGKKAFRYALILETDDDASIWTAMHANIKFTK